jgi:STE24 endopeptidase
VARILLLIPFLLWLIWSAQPTKAPADHLGVMIFIGGYLALVLAMAVWGRTLARRVETSNLHTSVRRFNSTMTLARLLVAAWFAMALYGGLGWGEWVNRVLHARQWPLMLPGTLLATAPVFLAWMGLWWSQFPADRALREQSLLFALEDDLPVHAPPKFWRYFGSQLRFQVLFTLIPIVLILLIRDVIYLALMQSGMIVRIGSNAEPIILMSASAAVFIFAPAILKHVLRTQPLPASPLRDKLQAMCRRIGLRYRDILLWQTDNNMGNAAVMGIVPWVRYILLSDLLLETMTDEQIEAVFAHEVGHIVYRHLAWYVVLVIILMLGMSAPAEFVRSAMESWKFPAFVVSRVDILIEIVGVALFFVLFGALSRRFERQADVYAARTMENARESTTAGQTQSHVGEYGASVFASALHRVAIINNIPISARNFSHGSIAARMKYLHALSADPRRTGRFDRAMFALYAALIGALILCGAAAAATF